MRILILGAGGQLANELERALAEDEVLALTHAEADICDEDAVERQARRVQPDCIVNTAAYHRVDDCEDEVERSFGVNAVALKGLCSVAGSVMLVSAGSVVFPFSRAAGGVSPASRIVARATAA